MAPPSPRRSSRARGSTISQSHQTSSTSSLSSRGGERNTRSLNKTASNKSTPTASLSSEPLDDFDDNLAGRRRTRGQDESRDKSRPEANGMSNEDEIQEDDESVRCVCGFDEYPGPPPFDEDVKHGRHNPEAEFFASIDLSDEVSGLFVQCDVCKVWQHGACVGIFTEESSPDEYFCENCRKDLHKIHTANNGQRYSNYLPLGRPSGAPSRAGSQAKDAGGARSPKEATGKNGRAASAAAQASKRRSTMNSRDAAYDEEELLRRAIEASKEEAPDEQVETAIRRAKRGRSDSEGNHSILKRQRTGSPSVSPPPEKSLAIEDDSEGEAISRSEAKKARNGRMQRDRTEREERDRHRSDNSSKRKGRADRRRAEDSDPSEEVPPAMTRSTTKQSVEPQPPPEPTTSTAPTPDPTPSHPAPTGSTHKKSARSHQKRGKGRNQYTKDREELEASPARSMTKDNARQQEEHHHQHGGGSAKSSGHASKSKASLHSKTSMSDMKRRVAAFLDFISKTQIEMAGEPSSGSRSSQSSSQLQSPHYAGMSGADAARVNGQSFDNDAKPASTANGNASTDGQLEHQNFSDLNCVEMMDVLTRDLVKWQNQYAT